MLLGKAGSCLTTAFNIGLLSWSLRFSLEIMKNSEFLTIICHKSLLIHLFSTRFASILGAQSEFKCPICLVPACALSDLCGDPYPKRLRNKTLTLIANADEQTSASAAKRALAAQSIRGISVGGWIVGSKFRMLIYAPRIHSLITLAFTCLCMKCFAPTPYIRLSKECGENISGSGSRPITLRRVSWTRLMPG